MMRKTSGHRAHRRGARRGGAMTGNETYCYTVLVTLEVEAGTEREAYDAVRRRLNHGYQYGDGVTYADAEVTKTVLIDEGLNTDG
jgi:hypothetical protein